MIFFENSNLGADVLKKFRLLINESNQPQVQLVSLKLTNCFYELYLIACDFPKIMTSVDPFIRNEVIKLHEVWNIIRGQGLSNDHIQRNNWVVIDKIGGRIDIDDKVIISPNLRGFVKDELKSKYFVLLTGNEPEGLPIFELNALCNLWQLNHHFYPIHVSGIIHHEKLFLFGGVSGAGKSTVSSLSSSIGKIVLDEDQLIIYAIDEEKYSANAWGKSTGKCIYPIGGIFELIKDNEDKLVPLSTSLCSQFLFAQVLQATGKNLLSYELRKEVFHIVSKLANSIPGYRLHFRKTPDFWKLIDAEFNLD